MFTVAPALLIVLLRPYGYEVTERCLVDWRQKGYLPQLSRRGRGYRRGVSRYWAEKDIVRRVLDVCRRLKGEARKREYGSIRTNWLAGADVAPHRVQKSWIRDLDRVARLLKYAIRKDAKEICVSLSLDLRSGRDTLEEIIRLLVQPNYRPGNSLDILFVRKFLRLLFEAMGAPKTLPPIDEKSLVQFLTWVNAFFSPAGIRSLLASATSADLRLARKRYWDWWARWGVQWQDEILAENRGDMLLGNTLGNALKGLMTLLAQLLAPLIVPLLLPARSAEARLACLEPV